MSGMRSAHDGEGQGMSLIVKAVTRLTLGFILLYGVYIALNGHQAPGGGFAGGVIVALSFVHVMLAFGKKMALRRLHSYTLRVVMSIGGLVFLYIVMIRYSGVYAPLEPILKRLRPGEIINNEIVIPFCEMAIVGAGLFATFIALVLLSKTDKDAE